MYIDAFSSIHVSKTYTSKLKFWFEWWPADSTPCVRHLSDGKPKWECSKKKGSGSQAFCTTGSRYFFSCLLRIHNSNTLNFPGTQNCWPTETMIQTWRKITWHFRCWSIRVPKRKPWLARSFAGSITPTEFTCIKSLGWKSWWSIFGVFQNGDKYWNIMKLLVNMKYIDILGFSYLKMLHKLV